jgi:hypothetical protein
MVWRISFTLAVAILFSIVLGVFEVGSKMISMKKGEVVATVNNHEIYESELESSLERTTTTLTRNERIELFKNPGIWKKVERNALEKLIHNELLLQAAEDEKYQVTRKETNEEIMKVKSSFTNEKEFNQALKKYNLTHQQFEEKVKEELLIAGYLDKKMGDIEVSEKELKKAINSLGGQESNSAQLEGQVKQELITKLKQKRIELFVEQLKKQNKIEIHI